MVVAYVMLVSWFEVRISLVRDQLVHMCSPDQQEGDHHHVSPGSVAVTHSSFLHIGTDCNNL